MAKRSVYLNWQAGNTFGWGILGLNLLFQWARDPGVRPLIGRTISARDLAMTDPLRLAVVAEAIEQSNRFQGELAAGDSILREQRVVLVDSVGNGLATRSTLTGAVNVGRAIFEDTRVGDVDRKLAKYDAMLCGSAWNAALLRSHTRKHVRVIHEGVDPSLFCPGARSGILDPGRFYIFSGGKVEHRKAQDLVLLAFREFSRRHDDAVLVTAWHSPWTQFSAGFKGRLEAPLGLTPKGALDFPRWLRDNGIDASKVIEIWQVPNPVLPTILREMDCALQPSRAEACTNLPAKEAMACGVPVIVARNTGVIDLVDGDNCWPLESQAPVNHDQGWGTEGWGESSVDEILQALETLYTDTQRRRRIGARGAEWIVERQRTWQRHARELKEYVLGL
jgi:glycosyltransferase involved in cell wall biosynthesis